MGMLLRLFRLGRIPAEEKQVLLNESSARTIEHIWVKVKLKSFRSKRKRTNWQVRILWGALMVTDQRIAAWIMGRRMVNAPWSEGRPEGLSIDSPKEGSLRFAFRAEDFDEQASGQVELVFYTPQARQLAARW